MIRGLDTGKLDTEGAVFLMMFSRKSFDLVETRSDVIKSSQVLRGFLTVGILFPCSIARQRQCLRRNDSGDRVLLLK